MGKFLDVAEIVLKQEGTPMRVKDLTDKAFDMRLLEFSNGKTPHQTIKAKLSVDIKSKGKKSRFMRTDKGYFALREFEEKEYKARPFQKTIDTHEKVLVFPVELLDEIGRFQGIELKHKKYVSKLLNPKNTRYLPRIEAETNFNFKQLISYVIVKKGGSVLKFVRGSFSNVRAFLKGQYCIGFGGHVQYNDYADQPLFSIADSGYFNSLLRELKEELNLNIGSLYYDDIPIVGVLNDDSSDLGKLHFAFVHMLDLDRLTKKIDSSLKKEKSINQLEWIQNDMLGSHFERYEYWSKLCIKAYFQKTVTIECKIIPIHNYSLRKHSKNLAIVGSIGSGKTEACKLLVSKFNYKLVNTGKIVQEILSLKPLGEIGRKEFQEKAYSFISNPENIEIFAEAIYQKMLNQDDGYSVLDGFRNPKTYELLKKKLGGKLTLIYIDSTIDNALRFYTNREAIKISPLDYFELLSHPVEKEVGQFINIANIVIHNHGDKKSYLKAISKYFEEELK